ncbi:hypothetical protein BGZ47_003510, partial [Haplosporangium gracile]
MSPVYQKTEPNAVVRKKLYGEAALSDITKKGVCDDPVAYGSAFKNELLENAGALNSSYITDEKLADFYDEKLACFRGCQDDPAKKLHCIPFAVASYEQYDRPRAEERERERQRLEAMKPKTGTN